VLSSTLLANYGSAQPAAGIDRAPQTAPATTSLERLLDHEKRFPIASLGVFPFKVATLSYHFARITFPLCQTEPIAAQRCASNCGARSDQGAIVRLSISFNRLIAAVFLPRRT
jgi:hypothetical protein